ncbi:hypothetical protein CW304_24040 [Bacillus sp. UFRGS-B20]|nr:hypothetical protein CW304_24040 [Bacillus sp. UFRGS-B20]
MVKAKEAINEAHHVSKQSHTIQKQEEKKQRLVFFLIYAQDHLNNCDYRKELAATSLSIFIKSLPRKGE